MLTPFLPRRSLLVLAFAGSLGTASAADVDDGPRRSRLELLPAALGGNSGVELRTQTANAPFALLLGASVNPIDPDGAGAIPPLRVLGPSPFVFVSSVNANGRFRVTAPVGNSVALQGVTVFAQALVATNGGLEATNVAATTIAPGAPSWSFIDRSASAPPFTMVNETGPGAAQDLDGDGDPDLAVISGAPATLRLYRNDGGFVFSDVTANLPNEATIEAGGVELFDADGDRRIDILLLAGPGSASNPPLANVLLKNLGNFQFQAIAFPDVPGLVRDVAIADFDRDGDLDVAFANGNDGVHSSEAADPNALLMNQGGAQGGVAGTFVSNVAFRNAAWNGPNFNLAVAAGDIDDDGDVDLFFGRADTQGADGIPGQPNVLLRNDGGLAFTDVSASNLQPLFSDNTEGARFGDLDGDGDLDLIVANSVFSIDSAHSGDLYRNQGNGVFVEDTTAFPANTESETALRLGVRLVDVDLDGDLDVVMFLHEFFDFDGSTGLPTGGDDQLFVNQGGAQSGANGTFVLDPAFTSGGIFVTSDQIWADFDLDGDADAFISNLGYLLGGPPPQSHLLENTRIP